VLTTSSRYLEARDHLYGRLTLTFHRVETVNDFLFVRHPPLVDKLRSLELSFQLSRRSRDPDWTAYYEDFRGLRGQLADSTGLQRLSIWLDTHSSETRAELVEASSLFVFDERLLPILTVSVPTASDEALAGCAAIARPWIEARGRSLCRALVEIFPWIQYAMSLGCIG